jgi:hypothetical protein
LAVLHKEGALHTLAYSTKVVGEICQEIIEDFQAVKTAAMECDYQCLKTGSSESLYIVHYTTVNLSHLKKLYIPDYVYLKWILCIFHTLELHVSINIPVNWFAFFL